MPIFGPKNGPLSEIFGALRAENGPHCDFWSLPHLVGHPPLFDPWYIQSLLVCSKTVSERVIKFNIVSAIDCILQGCDRGGVGGSSFRLFLQYLIGISVSD